MVQSGSIACWTLSRMMGEVVVTQHFRLRDDHTSHHSRHVEKASRSVTASGISHSPLRQSRLLLDPAPCASVPRTWAPPPSRRRPRRRIPSGLGRPGARRRVTLANIGYEGSILRVLCRRSSSFPARHFQKCVKKTPRTPTHTRTPTQSNTINSTGM
jgi:hypothetical protein